MASNKTVRAPNHVNLRTQQRRLRHIRSLAVRNLIFSEPVLLDPLAVKVRFTLHKPGSPDNAIYTSSFLKETYNPMWGSLLFSHSVIGNASTLSIFVIRVWLFLESRGEELLCFEKLINLSHYMFLGLSLNRKDNSSHPSNNIVIGMAEGFYIDIESKGYPSPRRPSFHQLMDFLPPQSLIEVRRTEVVDSYQNKDLEKLLEQQQHLNRLRHSLKESKRELQTITKNGLEQVKKQEERSTLYAHVELLRQFLEDQKRLFEYEKERLEDTKERLDKREHNLREHQQKFDDSRRRYENNQHQFSQRRDQLMKTQRKLHLRQRIMIAELAETFCIRQLHDTYTICGVILPHGDPLEGSASPEQAAVALGFVAHLVHLLAHFLIVPLQYPIRPNGSRSIIIDDVHDDQSLDIREFPLYIKGAEKNLYQFGLYLLWRDILQLRQHCGYAISRIAVKKTLLNLKTLLDRLMRDRYSISPLNETTPPTVSISSPSFSNQTPYTSSYFLIQASPPTLNRLSPQEKIESREGTATPTSGGSPNGIVPELPDTSQLQENDVQYESFKDEDQFDSRRHKNEPILVRSSPQVRKRPLFPPRSPRSRSPLELVQDQDGTFRLSQSPHKGTFYSLDVTRPISNTDRVLVNLPLDGYELSPSSSTSSSLSRNRTESSPINDSIPETNVVKSNSRFETTQSGNENIQTTSNFKSIWLESSKPKTQTRLSEFEAIQSGNEDIQTTSNFKSLGLQSSKPETHTRLSIFESHSMNSGADFRKDSDILCDIVRPELSLISKKSN